MDDPMSWVSEHGVKPPFCLHPDHEATIADLRSQLEAAQRERDEARDLQGFFSLKASLEAELRAERTKREETEQGLITLDRQWSERFTRESQLWERRLGEALAVLEELSEAAFWYGNSRSKPRATNADRKKGDRVFAALKRARAVLASRPSEPSAQTEEKE